MKEKKNLIKTTNKIDKKDDISSEVESVESNQIFRIFISATGIIVATALLALTLAAAAFFIYMFVTTAFLPMILYAAVSLIPAAAVGIWALVAGVNIITNKVCDAMKSEKPEIDKQNLASNATLPSNSIEIINNKESTNSLGNSSWINSGKSNCPSFFKNKTSNVTQANSVESIEEGIVSGFGI
jgi:membrane protein implicated in regulation of membrane protease activity